MKHYMMTEEQAKRIAARWNGYAAEHCEIEPSQAHLLFSDESETELEENGSFQVEVPARASATGNPITFYIDEDELTVTESE